MATAEISAPVGQSLSSKGMVDASLWWDPFSSLLTELENASRSTEFPHSLEKKLMDHQDWFLNNLSQFKTPNQISKEALNSPRIMIGSHELNVNPELKEAGLAFSSVMLLDEVQSYILVTRSMEHHNLASDGMPTDIQNLVILEYCIERQCLLKCARQILILASYVGSQSGRSSVIEEMQKLISNEIESKLLSNLLDMLSANSFEHMDVDLYTLWAEETLIEDNLILDIFFLAYHEALVTCDAKSWKRLCVLYEDTVTGSCNFQKLALSPEAIHAVYHFKVKLLIILVETLNLDRLLQMVHDNIPFRQRHIAFSEIDIQDMDAIISNFNVIEVKELGPLILAWAVFICLGSSLPEKAGTNVLMEINYIDYVRQAFEVSSLGYFLEILQSNRFKDVDVLISGHRSVLRTFISSFIASFEISHQSEDNNLNIILDILCNVYQGEEFLCNQFWDRDSFIDGPVRCLLCNLEGEFPFRSIELVRLLSALCEGSWPSECVFNFLNKSTGISTPLEISSDSKVDAVSNIVETNHPLHVSGIEGFVIPIHSKGRVLRMIDKNFALVRWEYTESGMILLISRLAHEVYTKSFEETIAILDLLCRLVTSNTDICYSLVNAGNFFPDDMSVPGNQNKNLSINVVEIVCYLVRNVSPSVNGTMMMSLGVTILTKMLKCFPYRVATMVLKVNIFDVDVASNSFSSGSWLLSGRLSRMLFFDCEQGDCSLTLSVLDFTMELLDTGLQDDTVFALIVFSVQYVLINHESWKFKAKYTRWNVTVKVLEIIKKCILSVSSYNKLGGNIRDILLYDSSVHDVLFRVVCTTTQSLENLYVSRLSDILDIEGLELAISSGLDSLTWLVSAISGEPQSFPVLYHAILSPKTKPMPLIPAAISLLSYFRNPNIQLGAARLLSMIFIAYSSQSFTHSNASLDLDDKQIACFRMSISKIISKQIPWNEDLVPAILKLLTSAVHNQPGLIAAVMDSKDESILNSILLCMGNSQDLLKSKPKILLGFMQFLRVLWQSAPQFTKILEQLKFSDKFWRHLTAPVLLRNFNHDEKLSDEALHDEAYWYQYVSNVLDIQIVEVFLRKKLGGPVFNGMPLANDDKDRLENPRVINDESLVSHKDIISIWCKGSLMIDIIKKCVSYEYDNRNHWRAKVAVVLCSVHMMRKLKTGDSGSLSVSVIGRIAALSKKLRELLAFSELSIQYTEHGYSGEQDMDDLILSDLFYHIQGEIEDRHIDNRLFKELFHFLLDSDFLDYYKHKQDGDILANDDGALFFDLKRLRMDLGLDMWDLLAWRECKEIAETMFFCLQSVNSMMLHSKFKLAALRGIISLLHMLDDNLIKDENSTNLGISKQSVFSSVDHICRCIHSTLKQFSGFYSGEDAFDFLAAQVELVLLLTRSIDHMPASSCVEVMKTLGYGLKVLHGFRQSVNVETAEKYFLLLILNLIKLCYKSLNTGSLTGVEVAVHAEASNVSLGLLPVLCNGIERYNHSNLYLTAVDFVLKCFSTPVTWFPIIQKYLPLRYIVQNLQDKTSSQTVPIMLTFLLNLARVREGAEMLLNADILISLRMLLSENSEGPFSSSQSEISFSYTPENTEKLQPTWGLSLAVLTAIIQSLEDTSYFAGIVDYVMSYIFAEDATSIMNCISTPDFPFEGRERKRARSLKSNVSVSELNQTQNVLTLVCVLVRHGNSWSTSFNDTGSKLREKSIHFLSVISRAMRRPGESLKRDTPIICPPVLKEERELSKEASSINIRNGWFALSALASEINLNLVSSNSSLVVRDHHSQENATSHPPTRFSDLVATEIYKIAFLLLKFLFIQAETAARKAEDIGFVDLAHFPELPMPDILHGLQGQGIAIITEVCEAHKTKPLEPDLQDICHLMFQITLLAMQLEYCVIQICGIRPVSGHAETLSKELQLLIRATEGHRFAKDLLQPLQQVVSLVYPELAL